MLQSPSFSSKGEPGGRQGLLDLDLAYLVQMLVRRRWTVINSLIVFVVLGIAVLVFVPSRYTSTSLVLIDTRRADLFRQDAVITTPTFDTSMVDSQVNILKSEGLLTKVIKKLKLTEDTEFVGDPNDLLPTINRNVMAILAFFGVPVSQGGEDALVRACLQYFADRLDVSRQGLSYVIAINMTSKFAGKSAKVANAIAEAYIADQLDSRFQATERAREWLQGRLISLQNQTLEAEKELLEFKASNNIFLDSKGGLINDQQVSELMSQLVQARAGTAQAQARMDQIKDVLKSEVPDASVADALQNQVIVKLRQQYLDAAKQAAEWSQRYGPDHGAVVNLRNQMKEIQRAVRDELNRIAESWNSDFLIAKAREESLAKSIRALGDQALNTRGAQAKAHALETKAATYRTLYDAFSQRQLQALEQQSFPVTEARVVSVATPPNNRSFPKLSIVMALAIIAGGGFGVMIAFGREMFDQTVRLPEQAQYATSTECLGILPLMEDEGPKMSLRERITNRLFSRPDWQSSRSAVVVDAPFSHFAETIRSIKIVAESRGLVAGNTVIGITSAVMNEGKTTVAINFARSLALAGHRVILLDLDIRNPLLSADVATSAKGGLLEVIGGTANVADVILKDHLTKLEVLPIVKGGNVAPPANYLTSQALKNLLQRLRLQYDYVVLDLPPIVPVIDVRSCVGLMDGIVIVIEWGSTLVEVVERAINMLGDTHDKIIGCVLNKVDLHFLKRFPGYGSREFASKYYRDYVPSH